MSDEQTAYDKLNDQQRLFIDALLEYASASGTIAKAAEKAGYTYPYGRLLVTKSYIMEALEERRKLLSRVTLYSQAELLEDLLRLKERCMTDVPVYDHKGKPTGEYRLDSSGANSALDKLGKMMGAYTDKVEHSGEVNGIMGIEIVFDKDLIDGDEE